jgi:hypothetical protein
MLGSGQWHRRPRPSLPRCISGAPAIFAIPVGVSSGSGSCATTTGTAMSTATGMAATGAPTGTTTTGTTMGPATTMDRGNRGGRTSSRQETNGPERQRKMVMQDREWRDLFHRGRRQADSSCVTPTHRCGARVGATKEAMAPAKRAMSARQPSSAICLGL